MQGSVSGVGGTSGLPSGPTAKPSIEELCALASMYSEGEDLEKIIQLLTTIIAEIAKRAGEAQQTTGTSTPLDESNPYFKTILSEVDALQDMGNFMLDRFAKDTNEYRIIHSVVTELTNIKNSPTSANIQVLSNIASILMNTSTKLPPAETDPITGKPIASGPTQITFWKKMADMFTDLQEFPQEIMDKCTEELAAIQKELDSIGDRSQTLQWLNELSDFVKIFLPTANDPRNPPLQPLTPEVLNKFITLLSNLSSLDLSHDLKTKAQITNMLTQLEKLQGVGGDNNATTPSNFFSSKLVGFIGFQALLEWNTKNPQAILWDSSGHPTAKMTELKSFIKAKFAELPFTEANDPFLARALLYNEPAIDAFVNNMFSTLTTTTPLRLPYVFSSNISDPNRRPQGNPPGTVITNIHVQSTASGFFLVSPPSEDLLKAYEDVFVINRYITYNSGTVEALEKGLNDLKKEIEIEVGKRNVLLKKQADVTKIKNDQEEALTALQTGQRICQTCVNNIFDNLSLPDAFKYAILDIFMPMQEAILEKYASNLYLGNKAADILNDIDGTLRRLDSATTNYAQIKNIQSRFPNYDSAAKNYTTTESDPKRIIDRFLSTERTQALSDKADALKAIDQLKQAKADVMKDTTLTPEQKTALVNDLDKVQQRLEAALPDLQAVIDSFQSPPVTVTIISVSNGVTRFQIKFGNLEGPAALDALSDLETNVIDGHLVDPHDPNNKERSGGLTQIKADIAQITKKYSIQNQQAQLELQNAMTKVQQQWTIVSTSLQLLNQMYMSLARGVKGG